MKSELDKIRSRLVKAQQKVTDIRSEETAYIKSQTVACCMVFDQGTLFEKSCKGEMIIGDTTLYQIIESGFGSYGDEESYDTGCKIKCTCCGSVLYLPESKWLSDLKRYFKKIVVISKNTDIK